MGALSVLLIFFSIIRFSDTSSLKLLGVSPLPSTTVPPEPIDFDNATGSGNQIEHLVPFNESETDEAFKLLAGSDIETVTVDASDNSTTVSAAFTNATTPTASLKKMIRTCRCTEVLECRMSALSETDNCFEKCDDQLQLLGDDTISYIDCFEKDQRGITHAESCLESVFAESCSTSHTPQYIERREHEGYINAKFITNKEKEPKRDRRPLMQRPHHHLLSGFYQFYHCAKQCVHRRMFECFRQKSCAIRLPSSSSFGDSMVKCAKSNVKVARSLRSTCQCLLHKKKLKNIGGTCAIINPHRIKMR